MSEEVRRIKNSRRHKPSTLPPSKTSSYQLTILEDTEDDDKNEDDANTDDDDANDGFQNNDSIDDDNDDSDDDKNSEKSNVNVAVFNDDIGDVSNCHKDDDCAKYECGIDGHDGMAKDETHTEDGAYANQLFKNTPSSNFPFMSKYSVKAVLNECIIDNINNVCDDNDNNDDNASENQDPVVKDTHIRKCFLEK